MSVSEDRRIAVLEAATHHWGRDVAVTLMEMLPPSGWGDVATRQQVEGLRTELRAELQVAIAELRADFEGLRADMAEGQRRMQQWTVGTAIAMGTLFTTVVALVR